MQPGHEEVALAPEELSEELLLSDLSQKVVFSCKTFLTLLLIFRHTDPSSIFAQEMTVRLKREMRIMYKILLIIFYSPVMRENKFENSYIHILEPETLSRESRVTESAQEVVN